MPHMFAARTLGTALPRALLHVFLRARRRLLDRRSERWTMADPGRFDDRLLRDIGVSRSDLLAADRLGPRPRRDGAER